MYWDCKNGDNGSSSFIFQNSKNDRMNIEIGNIVDCKCDTYKVDDRWSDSTALLGQISITMDQESDLEFNIVKSAKNERSKEFYVEYKEWGFAIFDAFNDNSRKGFIEQAEIYLCQ